MSSAPDTQDPDRLLRAMAHAVDVVLVLDSEAVIRLVSPSGPVVFGYNAPEVIGTNALDMVHPGDIVLTVDAIANAISGPGRKEPIKIRVQDGHGSWRPVGIIGVNRLDDPEVGGIVLTIRDFTESVAQERYHQEGDDHYRQIVELASEGVWVLDADEVTTMVTGRMASMLGRTVDEMVGHSLFEFMDDEARSIAGGHLERRRLGISESLEFGFLHRDGHEVWTRISATPVMGQDGEYRGAVAMVSDVSAERDELRRVREETEALRVVLAACPDEIYRVASDGTCLECYSPPTTPAIMTYMVGRRLDEQMPAASAGALFAAVTEAVRSGSVAYCEIERDLDGTATTYRGRAVPIGGSEVVLILRAEGDDFVWPVRP